MADTAADGASFTRRSVLQLTGAAAALPAAPLQSNILENSRMSFTPKFVDLVRNTTSTTGTSDFTLGAAMTGFTSFTAACQVGDCFYYSAIGIDKPSEREVGRGTLLDGGVISRDPIDGVKTNFSNGTKAVALIAAAEWFAEMQAGASGPPMAATRPALAMATPQRVAVLSEAGREGLFMFNPANLSARVAADAGQGIYVAPTSDASGASGAWVRKYDGSVNVKWFGAKGDGSTDDSAAFIAALDYLKAIAGNAANSGIYVASPRLFIPAGNYYLATTTLDVTHTLIIEGEGGQGFGAGGGAATKLRWAADTTGIRIQANNTSGASTVDAANHTSGAFTTLRHLYLYGAFQSEVTPEGEYHGIHVKASAFLDNVQVDNFQGDALHAHTSIGGGSPDEGFSNNSRVYNSVFRNSRNGVSIHGGDANVWLFLGCNFSYNRACGVDDASFLGNTYVRAHANGNGITADNLGTAAFPAYVVSNGGNRYCPVQGQEAAASTTAPTATADTATWLYLGTGGAMAGIPAWSNGMSLRCGAAYRTNNANAENAFYDPYAEGGQGADQFTAPTMIHGGVYGPGVGSPRGTATWLRNFSGVLACDKIGSFDGNYGNYFQADSLIMSQAAGGLQSLEWFNGDLCWTILRSANPAVFSYQILGEATANPVGKRHINFPNGFGFASQKRFPGSTMPTTGDWVAGDFVENTSRSELGSAGSKYVLLGWHRVTTGSGNVLNADWLECRAQTGN